MGVIGKALGGVVGWMLKNPAIVILCFFIAMFGMVVVSKNSEINTLRDSIENPTTGWRKRNEVAIATITTLRGNNIKLADGIARQNEALEGLRAQGEAAGQRFDQLMAGMAASNAIINRKIAAINAAQPGPDQCQSAFDLLKGAAQ